MASVRGTQTESNLLTAFAGESQASNRYLFFASAARKEGLVQIGAVLEEVACQEREHAKRFFSFLEGGNHHVMAAFPAGVLGTTVQNLRAAAADEREEWMHRYPRFAQVAREEGLIAVAVLFDNVAVAERFHERRLTTLANNLDKDLVFSRPHPVLWHCRQCGFVHESTQAPRACPTCTAAWGYFEIADEKF